MTTLTPSCTSLPTRSSRSPEGAPTRRGFLGGAAAAALAAPAVAGSDTLPPWMRSPGGADLPYGAPSGHEAAASRHPGLGNSGIASWHTPLALQRGQITATGLHFAIHHSGVPDIDPARHELVIHGLVERPLRFGPERLERYPVVSRVHFLECAGNTAANALSPFAMDLSVQDLSGQVSGGEWAGVPLSLLLREARPRPNAAWVIAEGADGGSHHRSLPLARLLDDALLALYLNGERLRPSQGYPMRLFVPGWEGNANVKWLHRLELSDQPAYSKDESGLYTEVLADGRLERFTLPMEVKSLITQPSGRQQIAPGRHEIRGLAWSGRGRITRVEVSADAGASWADALLHGPVLPMAFTPFSLPWSWNGRATTLMSRAHDESARVQPTRRAWKQRYAAHSFNHYNAIQAWRIRSDGRVENSYA